eukprot:761243-Hanusia_phi.AAC.6
MIRLSRFSTCHPLRNEPAKPDSGSTSSIAGRNAFVPVRLSVSVSPSAHGPPGPKVRGLLPVRPVGSAGPPGDSEFRVAGQQKPGRFPESGIVERRFWVRDRNAEGEDPVQDPVGLLAVRAVQTRSEAVTPPASPLGEHAAGVRQPARTEPPAVLVGAGRQEPALAAHPRPPTH